MTIYSKEPVDTELLAPLETALEPVGRIPDGAPTVAMDIKLGEQYGRVDFDYDAFKREADRQGMPTEAREELAITIKPPAKGLDRTGGAYWPSNKTISVSAGDKVNKRLAHEMKHATDDANGDLVMGRRYPVGQLSLTAMNYIAPTTIGLNIAKWTELLPIAEAATITMNGTIVALGGAAVYGYFMHPAERRARKAEAENKETMIKFEPKKS